jgi:hypothetical protein
VTEPTATEQCQFPGCQERFRPSNRGGQAKRFCSNRHRVAYHAILTQQTVKQVQDAVQETQDELARLQARLSGAMAQLQRLEHTPRKSAGRTKKDLTPAERLA